MDQSIIMLIAFCTWPNIMPYGPVIQWYALPFHINKKARQCGMDDQSISYRPSPNSIRRNIHHIFELNKKAELFDRKKQIFGSPKTIHACSCTTYGTIHGMLQQVLCCVLGCREEVMSLTEIGSTSLIFYIGIEDSNFEM